MSSKETLDVIIALTIGIHMSVTMGVTMGVTMDITIRIHTHFTHDTRKRRVSCIVYRVYRYIHDHKCLIHDTFTKIVRLCITIKNSVGLQYSAYKVTIEIIILGYHITTSNY